MVWGSQRRIPRHPENKKGISEYLLDIENPFDFLARDTRFELVTSASGGQRSIQLS
jgi:hypothetical protein